MRLHGREVHDDTRDERVDRVNRRSHAVDTRITARRRGRNSRLHPREIEKDPRRPVERANRRRGQRSVRIDRDDDVAAD
jgi:hypothetical protein